MFKQWRGLSWGRWSVLIKARTFFFGRGVRKGALAVKVLLPRNRRGKEDRIGERQPFRERTLYV
jgi:hypothetical protein